MKANVCENSTSQRVHKTKNTEEKRCSPPSEPPLSTLTKSDITFFTNLATKLTKANKALHFFSGGLATKTFDISI